jgi:hypothetical protein
MFLSDLIEENLHGIFLVQSGSRQAAMVKGTLFTKSDHFLSNRSGCFSLSQSRRHSAMLD